MKKILIFFKIGICLLFIYVTSNQTSAQTTIEKHGLLHTKGNKIVDKNDSIVSFSGMSLFWSNWGGKYYNDSVIGWLHSDWDCKIVRAAMGIEGNSSGEGYLNSPETEKAKVITVVDACIEKGIYVIIDWHDHNADKHETEAIEFFTEMAMLYGNSENVIYEIFNEPLDISWKSAIKPYAEKVIAAIRVHDPDNLIVVGTRQWSQMISEVAEAPINDVNVAYVMHFYVGSHGQWLRDETTKALNLGVPVFVTEWGVWGETSELDTWFQYLKDNGISNCNWSITDKVEPSSALNIGASEFGNWSELDLTRIGQQVRNYVMYWDSTYTPELPPIPCDTFILNRKIQAENFCSMSGIQTENCTDAGAGNNVAYINTYDWMDYIVNMPEADSVTFEYRVAGQTSTGKIEMQLLNDTETITLHEVSFTGTGGWQTWKTVAANAYLPEGVYSLKLIAKANDFNLNWINITDKYEITSLKNNTGENIKIYPNPAHGTLNIQSSATIKVEIATMNGQIVISNQNLLGISQINLNSLIPGTYLIKTIENDMVTTNLLIIN